MERLNDHRRIHDQCARACGVYMYLIFIMIGQNISNDGDKGVQICISSTFIEPRAFIRNKSLSCINAECTLAILTVALTDAADMFVNGRKSKVL